MWYKNRKEDADEKSKCIISTAAKILISEIRSRTFECDSNPANECISDLDKNMEWLPPKLRLFMETLIRLPIKRASIGQCLANAIRPRSIIPPLLFGLAVEMDHASVPFRIQPLIAVCHVMLCKQWCTKGTSARVLRNVLIDAVG